MTYDERQLDWFSRRLLRQKPLPEITELMVPYWRECYGLSHRADDTDLDPVSWQRLLASAIREQVHCLSESSEKALFALSDALCYDEPSMALMAMPYAPAILEAFEAGIAGVPLNFSSIDGFVSNMRWQFKASCGIRSRDVMHVIRAALTGRIDGPCLVVVCQLLGRQLCIERSRSARLERCRV
jgi:glutamyl-tRNA synthetase